MKVFADIIQGSDDWWTVRHGIPTASSFSRIITSKGRLSKQADAYIAELISDIACLNPKFFTSRGTEAMRNGQACEPEARAWYEMDRNVNVQQVGFCLTDDGRFGCSPDGLVGEDGLLELKCPELKTHSLYLIKGTLPGDYRAQCHGQLVVTGRKWVDFLSYAPGLEPLLIRVEPDEFTEALATALDAFWDRFQTQLAKQHPKTAALKAWRDWLGRIESLDDLNHGLPNLASLAPDIKGEAWEMCKKYAEARGYVFHKEGKVFLPAENPDADPVEVFQ